jgi:hypothetical protein
VFDRYRADCIPQLQRRIDALDTWRRWAWGDSINTGPLADTVHTLIHTGGDDDGRFRALAQTIQDWAVDADIHLPGAAPPIATPLHISGPELGP